MKKIHFLATTAALLVAASAPSFAASRIHNGADAYASGAATTDRSGAYYYGPQDVQGRATAAPFRDVQPQYNRGQNQPFSDRPYGNPDNW